MEFYPFLLQPKQHFGVVSIPNGMEFYLDLLASTHTRIWSFNSQRDGILPLASSTGETKFWVSIPNGMEFYHDMESLYFLVRG